MSFLTKGLSLSGVFAYQTNANGYHITTQSYEKYPAERMTTTTCSSSSFRKGSDIDTPLSVSKGSTEYYHLDGIVHLDYARRFGRHSVSAMGYMLYQSLSQQYTGSGANNLNYKRLHSGFQEPAYGYDDRYLVKFDLGYSGSDQFARDHRFMATPSVSGAWVSLERGLSARLALASRCLSSEPPTVRPPTTCSTLSASPTWTTCGRCAEEP